MVKRISLLITKSNKQAGNPGNFQGFLAAINLAQQMITIFTSRTAMLECVKLAKSTDGRLLSEFFYHYNGPIGRVVDIASRVHIVVNYNFKGPKEDSYFDILIVAYAPGQKRSICNIKATFGIYSDQPTTMSHCFPLSSTPPRSQ
jgi:hypothetical protein